MGRQYGHTSWLLEIIFELLPENLKICCCFPTRRTAEYFLEKYDKYGCENNTFNKKHKNLRIISKNMSHIVFNAFDFIFIDDWSLIIKDDDFCNRIFNEFKGDLIVALQ